ncbi:hypothetical protein TcasGA2_TC011552 [Tribolium castaneum]|uniref:Uncharacterized protein n=1 Tax=Tribolium castaneum TaxID=7070 RepID=D6W6F0_TRICA|nr:PREDICTED: uncharacterized protein LOC657698 [Tribolium castaneum]EFA11392.1 hypothetical protein TcasGA2_TC011552 [Tribolium castaneum]|eukprot:XP_975814.1 PREDICTED: uncharacterized protein LOC657698 [Tribolium castaneum]
MSLDGIVVRYPNYTNNELPMVIGCPFETTIDDAKNFFLRCCYKDVVISDIVPWKRNCQPSCAWRVIYKLKDRTPDYVEPGKTVEDFCIPLPEGDGELNKLFANITAMSVGMIVATKGYTYDKTYALVDYVPVRCPCPTQDFSETAKLMIPRMQSVTEVSLTFGNMTL